MAIRELEKRLAGMQAVLTQLSDGRFDAPEVEPGDDALGQVEQALNFVLMDLQTMTLERKEREAFLEQQQRSLLEKTEVIERQRLQVSEQERDLQVKLNIIHQQAGAIAQLSTPIMEIWHDVLLLPIVGTIDTHRSIALKRALLQTIGRTRARCVIMDITGVELVDSGTANHLLKVVRASGLMGAKCVLTGLSDCVAETLVDLGVDLSEVATLGSLRDGLRFCLKYIRTISTTTAGTREHGS
jgi:rsbT co-antagonist protein RsbR